MDKYWIPIIAIIATLIAPLFSVLLQEILIRAREKPKTNELEQKTTQRNFVTRWLLLIFPPDERIILLIIDSIIAFFLVIILKSSEPLTRIQVFYIAALVAAFAVTFLIDTFITVFKLMIAMNERLIETTKTVNALNQVVESGKVLSPPTAETLVQKPASKQTSRTRKKA